MDSTGVNSINGIFADVPDIISIGMLSVVLVLLGFFSIKFYCRVRGNTAFTSYQHTVVAPVQYGDRASAPKAPAPKEDVFSRRLDELADEDERYEMAKLLPQARELVAIKNADFHTAPMLAGSDLGVLALFEEEVQAHGDGFRVLVNASLETLVNLEEHRGHSCAGRLPLAGIVLKFSVVDRFGRLIMAVEHMNDSPLGRQENISRTVLIEVLRKAGVWYLEIPHHYSGANARAQIKAVLQGKAAVQNSAENVA